MHITVVALIPTAAGHSELGGSRSSLSTPSRESWFRGIVRALQPVGLGSSRSRSNACALVCGREQGGHRHDLPRIGIGRSGEVRGLPSRRSSFRGEKHGRQIGPFHNAFELLGGEQL
jgi:hypothetical protein